MGNFNLIHSFSRSTKIRNTFLLLWLNFILITRKEFQHTHRQVPGDLLSQSLFHTKTEHWTEGTFWSQSISSWPLPAGDVFRNHRTESSLQHMGQFTCSFGWTTEGRPVACKQVSANNSQVAIPKLRVFLFFWFWGLFTLLNYFL